MSLCDTPKHEDKRLKPLLNLKALTLIFGAGEGGEEPGKLLIQSNSRLFAPLCRKSRLDSHSRGSRNPSLVPIWTPRSPAFAEDKLRGGDNEDEFHPYGWAAGPCGDENDGSGSFFSNRLCRQMPGLGTPD
jgi:hypothetical protein